MNWDVWGPPLLALGLGLAAGAALVFRARSASGGSRTASIEDLHARKANLYERILAIDAERATDGHSADALRVALVDEAATVLRDLDALQRATAPVDAPSTGSSNLGKQALIYAVGAALLFAALGATLVQFTKPKPASMQGPDAAFVAWQAELEQSIAQAEEALLADPQDLGALNLLSYEALLQRDVQTAMDLVDRARAVAPTDPDVLLHLGILQSAVGMTDRALESANLALAASPGRARFKVWRGLFLLQRADREGAGVDLQAAIESGQLDPREAAFANSLLSEVNAVPAQERVAGQVQLAEGTPAPSEGLIYVIVRRSMAPAGPPLAAKKLAAQFPLTFSITDEDMMLGGAWPEQVWVQARWDLDGNAMTKDDGDLETTVLGPLSSGATGLSLVLGGTSSIADDPAAPPAPVEQVVSAGAKAAGTITLADGATPAAGATLFLIARRSDARKGPPLAAQRVPNPSFPLTFSLGEADLMMGGAWPQEAWIEARLDEDGDAMTKGAADLGSTLVGPVQMGATDVALELGG